MLINPQEKLRSNLFYNNLCFIVLFFCILCFLTSIFFQNSTVKSVDYYNLSESAIIGPIKVDKKANIYKITAHFRGFDTYSYISGEVLDEDKDTLYEFGKDLWHESGYDSEGHWEESDRNLTAYLSFQEKGTYYLQFHTDENNLSLIDISITLMKGSSIPHLKVGIIFFFIMFIVWSYINWKWFSDILTVLYDKIIEMSEEDDD